MIHKIITIIVTASLICLNLPGHTENHQGNAIPGYIRAKTYSSPGMQPSTFNYMQKGSQDDKYNKGSDGWEEMYFRAIKINDKSVHFIVSSELEPVNPFEGLGRYGGHNLFDNDSSTAWVEGVEGNGTGQYILFETDENFPRELKINIGYQKSERLFKLNSRPHTVLVSLYAGFYLDGDDTEIASRYRLRQITEQESIEFDDRMGSQSFEIPFNPERMNQLKDSLVTVFSTDFREEIERRKQWCPTCDMTPRFSYFIRIEIGDVYKGTEWEDNCISGLSYTNNPGIKANGRISDSEKIIDVFEDIDHGSGQILIDTDSRKGIPLVDEKKLEEYKKLDTNQHLSITLMDVSPDKEWAQVDLMFYEQGGSRVEEYSALFNVRLRKRVDESLLKTRYGFQGFIEKDGRIWLDTVDGYIDLDEIRDKMIDER